MGGDKQSDQWEAKKEKETGQVTYHGRRVVLKKIKQEVTRHQARKTKSTKLNNISLT